MDQVPIETDSADLSTTMAEGRRRLPVTLFGNALIRIAGSASGVLVGLYLADLANHGARLNAALAGTLGAVSFGAELAGSVPLGLASDAIAPRVLMAGGALLGAVAAQLFGMTHRPNIFFLSRALEGLGAAAVVPPLLAHLTDVTDGKAGLRARVMSYFELSLLGGLALGGLMAGELWRLVSTRAFAVMALVYVVCAGLLFFGAVGSRGHGAERALTGFVRALRQASLRHLAPVWLCVNSIVGLWLGPTFTFLLTQRTETSQFLAGIFADHPESVGWALLAYSLIFGVGVTGWSLVLPRMQLERGLRIALFAMLGASVGFFLFNHSGHEPAFVRWVIGACTTVCIMVESGFTPAALALLAGAVGAQAGRGAAMGIYSVLLSVGAIGGSLLAAVLGERFAVDGLIYGTLAMAVVALFFARRLEVQRIAVGA
jgi:MFS family permease